MKVALTVWGKRISPMFDCARTLLIADIEGQEVTRTRYASIHSENPTAKAKVLFDLDVSVLICGAISNFYANMVEAYGIRIVSFITGDVRQVLDVYARGLLPHPNYQLPGYKGDKQRHFRNSRSRGKAREPMASEKKRENPLLVPRGR